MGSPLLPKTRTVKARKKIDTLVPGEGERLNAREILELSRALERTRKRMGKFYQGNQILGRKGAIGCVSLEISQRCNLDCSLCYLSDRSNGVTDLPLREVFRRIDGIRENFGVGTNVQISGGDPTLRNRKELVCIVRYTRKLGLLPALFTNGIRCSRDLLEELAENGLSDVAFHVDLSQGRRGFPTETSLNALREEYIDRARGLPVMVVFNTTVHGANFHEIPALVRFFLSHADGVGFASFQLQAETGRGVLRRRPGRISLASVRQKINEGAGAPLPWDAIRVGHPGCHSYVPVFAVKGRAFGILDDAGLYADFLKEFSHVTHDRREKPSRIAWRYVKAASGKPLWILRGIKYFLPRLWSMRKEIVDARGRVHKISFFIQNFMDANRLDPDRIEACSFMVMTPQGPMSMCEHNAKREKYILPSGEVPAEPGKVLHRSARSSGTGYGTQQKKVVLGADSGRIDKMDNHEESVWG
ncbi:MAG: radical SAM protein [Nitrospinaceae bacterium]